MKKVIKLKEADLQRIVKRVIKEQMPVSPCKKLRDKEIVVLFNDSNYVGQQDIVGTYSLQTPRDAGGFVPRKLDKKSIDDLDLIEKLEKNGYLEDLVKSKHKPKWGIYAFKDELKSSTTRLSNITSSEEIKKMIDDCVKARRGRTGGRPPHLGGWKSTALNESEDIHHKFEEIDEILDEIDDLYFREGGKINGNINDLKRKLFVSLKKYETAIESHHSEEHEDHEEHDGHHDSHKSNTNIHVTPKKSRFK